MRSLTAGEWLFRVHEPPDALYVVGSGRLRVVAGEGEQEATIRVVGPGALLGELGVLTGSSRSASVQAVRDSVVAELEAERFSELVASDASFAVTLARELARQLQQSGGLLPPQASAAVYTIVSAGTARVVEPVLRRLEAEFAAFGSTAALRASDVGADPGATLAQTEAKSRYVLLLVDDGDEEPWRAFALRQSDRVLVFTDGRGSRGARAETVRGAELAFVGNPSSAAVAEWLDEVEPRAHYVVPDGDADAVARVARRLTGRSLGVVLSGGGARGFAHIGALEGLRAAGFEIDRIGGCSIGSFIGAMAALGWSTERILDVCESELVRRAPFSDYTIPRFSLIRARRAAAMLERVFGATLLEEIERPFFTVSADLLGSALVVHRRGPVFEGVGASMSIPGLAPPVSVGRQLLVDGGVLNNLPVDLMDHAEGPVVAVDVIRRMEHDEPLADRSPRLPSIMETLSRATVLGSVERSERNRRLAALTITPDVQSIGLREFGRLRQAVEAGRVAADSALEDGGAETLRTLLSQPVPPP
jgi:NTE family protein